MKMTIHAIIICVLLFVLNARCMGASLAEKYFTDTMSVYGSIRLPTSTNEVVCYNCCGYGWVPKQNNEKCTCLQCNGRGCFPFGHPHKGIFRNNIPCWKDKNTLRIYQIPIHSLIGTTTVNGKNGGIMYQPKHPGTNDL